MFFFSREVCVEVKLHSWLLSDIYLYLFYDFPGFENISCYIVLIPCRDLKAMKHTYALKRKTSHGMALVRSYPLRKVATLPAWLFRWCSGHHARLVTGEAQVRFRLGATCSSFHMRCVSKVKLYSRLLSDIYLYFLRNFKGMHLFFSPGYEEKIASRN